MPCWKTVGCGSSALSLRELYTHRARGNLRDTKRKREKSVRMEKWTENCIQCFAKGCHVSAPILCEAVNLFLIVKLHVQLVVEATAPITAENTAQIKYLSVNDWLKDCCTVKHAIFSPQNMFIMKSLLRQQLKQCNSTLKGVTFVTISFRWQIAFIQNKWQTINCDRPHWAAG